MCKYYVKCVDDQFPRFVTFFTRAIEQQVDGLMTGLSNTSTSSEFD